MGANSGGVPNHEEPIPTDFTFPEPAGHPSLKLLMAYFSPSAFPSGDDFGSASQKCGVGCNQKISQFDENVFRSCMIIYGISWYRSIYSLCVIKCSQPLTNRDKSKYFKVVSPVLYTEIEVLGRICQEKLNGDSGVMTHPNPPLKLFN